MGANVPVRAAPHPSELERKCAQGASPLGVSSNGAAVPSSVINAAMRTGLTPLLLSAFLNASQVRDLYAKLWRPTQPKLAFDASQ